MDGCNGGAEVVGFDARRRQRSDRSVQRSEIGQDGFRLAHDECVEEAPGSVSVRYIVQYINDRAV